MRVQMQRPSHSKTPKKPRSRDIKVNIDTYIPGVDIWTNRVERGRKCQICRRRIEAGEQSLRYIRKDMVYGKYDIPSEKAICPDCAIKSLEKMMVELKQPIDQAMFMRMKRNQPEPQTQW